MERNPPTEKPKRKRHKKTKTLMILDNNNTLICNNHDPWANLHSDILRSILSKLQYIDHLSFRAVCKNWFQPSFGVRPAPQLPFIMYCRWLEIGDKTHPYKDRKILSLCKLFKPSFNGGSTYTIEDEIKSRKDRRKFVDAHICASNSGWLLFQYRVRLKPEAHSFFLYSPFTHQLIEDLPRLPNGCCGGSFTSDPTSPDCLFFLVYPGHHYSKPLTIYTCHRGDITWTPLQLRSIYGMVQQVTYLDGSFFCLFNHGVLGEFNVVLQEWRVVRKLRHLDLRTSKCYLVVSDGHLLLVERRTNRVNGPYRLDRSLRDWIKEESLGNRALFLSHPGSFSISALGDASGLAGGIIFLSLSYPGDLMQLNSYSTVTRAFGAHNEICNSLQGETLQVLNTWIEPPHPPQRNA